MAEPETPRTPRTPEKGPRNPRGAGRKKKPDVNRADATVRIDKQVATRAKVLAGHHGSSVSDYLSAMLREPIRLAWNEMNRETGFDEIDKK